MFPWCFHMFPRVSMVEKRIKGIGWGQLSEMASRFLLLSPAAKLGSIKFTGIGPPRLSFPKVVRPQKRSGAELYASRAAHAYSANPNKVRVRPYTSTLAACPLSPTAGLTSRSSAFRGPSSSGKHLWSSFWLKRAMTAVNKKFS